MQKADRKQRVQNERNFLPTNKTQQQRHRNLPRNGEKVDEDQVQKAYKPKHENLWPSYFDIIRETRNARISLI